MDVNSSKKHQHNNIPQRQCKRVAVYCRVSKNAPAQLASLEQQIHAYQKMIALNPEWELVEIYSDILWLTDTKTPRLQQTHSRLPQGQN